MSWRNRWWIAALVAACLLIGATFPLARQLSWLPFVFGPVAVVALIAAAARLGVQRAGSASFPARLRNGVQWAVFAVAVLALPGAMQLALFWWESYGLPRPPDATLIPETVHTGWTGRHLAWKTGHAPNELESFYVERLSRRGWRLEVSADAGSPAGAAAGSMRVLLFRRIDGRLLVTIMEGREEKIVATRYSQFDDSMRESSPLSWVL